MLSPSCTYRGRTHPAERTTARPVVETRRLRGRSVRLFDYGVGDALGLALALAVADGDGTIGAVAPISVSLAAPAAVTVPAIDPVPLKSTVAGSRSNPPPMVLSVLGNVALQSAPLMSMVVAAVVVLVGVIAMLPKNGVHPPSGVVSGVSSVSAPATTPAPNPPVAVPVKVTQLQVVLAPEQVEA